MSKCCKGRKLEITNISIDPPKSTFSIGSNFRHVNIKVLAIYLRDSTVLEKKVLCLVTDCKGEFTIPTPPETNNIEIKIKLNVAQSQPGDICDCHCVTISGSYGIYNGHNLNWRTYSGVENNLKKPYLGSVDQPLLRKASSDYEDGVSTLAVRGTKNPNPRIVSNNICKQKTDIPNTMNLSDMVWVWGQFLDHEIDITHTGSEYANITTPTQDEDSEEEYPERTIIFQRSEAVYGSSPREQPNSISAYIDGTNVYGYEHSRSFALRRLDGTGTQIMISSDNSETILGYNTNGLSNAALPGQPPESLFLAGDVRANENIFLTAMHTLFAREHNRLCSIVLGNNPLWEGYDELIFQHARRIVAGQMQVITFNEFLPALLGPYNLGTYQGYNSSVDPSIATEFSTVGYRLGHTMLSSVLQKGKDSSDTILLRDAFFKPEFIQANGIDGLLIGASKKRMQQIDGKIVDDVRNFLFGSPSASHLLDLATLNIQRGRDHGIPGYNAVRIAYGLEPKNSFSDITSDTNIQSKLAELYDDPDSIDPWVGTIIEDHLPNAAVGELLVAILRDQFGRLRNGDRFWFENDQTLSEEEKEEIRNTKLSDIIVRNTRWTSSEISEDVFHV